MKIPFLACALLAMTGSMVGQENNSNKKETLIVRYDFAEKASPPMKVFYIRVYVDNKLSDSTKPHTPHHNLANAVDTYLTAGSHKIRVEGVIEERGNIPSNGLTVVMEWEAKVVKEKSKYRIHLKLDSDFQVSSVTQLY